MRVDQPLVDPLVEDHAVQPVVPADHVIQSIGGWEEVSDKGEEEDEKLSLSG